MDNSFHRPEADTQQKRGLLNDWQIFDSILPLMQHSLNWLVEFFKLTEGELEDAGVYLGRLGDE
jgi:hypothetical protein